MNALEQYQRTTKLLTEENKKEIRMNLSTFILNMRSYERKFIIITHTLTEVK